MAWSEPPWLRARAGALGVAALIVIGCAKPEPTRTPKPEPPPLLAAKPCAPHHTALRVVMHDDLPVRAFVPVVKEGAAEHLLFDTGSAHTFVAGDAPVFIDVACRRFRAGALPMSVLPPGPEGRKAIGLVGADEVTLGVTEIDLRSEVSAIVHHERLPEEVASWTKVAVEKVEGIIVTNAEVDGRPMRLFVDTGTDRLLVLDREIDEEHAVASHDSGGNALKMVPRWAMLRWDTAEPRRVSSWHLRSHPAFERHAKQIGGADGILGLADFGRRRVVFDVPNGALYLER